MRCSEGKLPTKFFKDPAFLGISSSEGADR